MCSESIRAEPNHVLQCAHKCSFSGLVETGVADAGNGIGLSKQVISDAERQVMLEFRSIQNSLKWCFLQSC